MSILSAVTKGISAVILTLVILVVLVALIARFGPEWLRAYAIYAAAPVVIPTLMAERKVEEKVKNLPWPWDPAEENLLKALKDNNLSRFEGLLSKGADPNAIFGKEPEEWVMCEANRRGKEAFLKLAVEHGGDINLRNTTPPLPKSIVHGIFSAPILCAINMYNDAAFDYLVSKGVDLGIHVRTVASPMRKSEHIKPELWGKTHYGSPLIEAANVRNYRMVYEVMQRKALTEEEAWVLKRRIEKRDVDLKGERNTWRLKVAELLREQGHEVMPRKGDD